MPLWSYEPPTELGRGGLRLLRTPTSRPITGIVTSDGLLGCPTHFYRGRTVPCATPEPCEACESGNNWRWHAYLAAIVTQTHEHAIFEWTAQAAEVFRRYSEAHDGLRGCYFKAWRAGQRPNGRVIVNCGTSDLRKVNLPHAPDIRKLMSAIWGLTTDQIEPAGSRYADVPGCKIRPAADDEPKTLHAAAEEILQKIKSPDIPGPEIHKWRANQTETSSPSSASSPGATSDPSPSTPPNMEGT